MEFTARAIAALINGKVEGNPDTTVTGIGRLENATEGQIAFLANPKYEDFLYSTKASIIIINESQQLEKNINATLIRVEDAYSGFAALLSEYDKIKRQNLSGIQQPVFIHATARIGENVFIGDRKSVV